MATLLTVRTLVRNLLDEATAVRWADSEINGYIQSAVDEVLRFGAANGLSLFHQSASVTASSGLADLSSLKPIRILSVAEDRGGGLLLQIPAIRPRDAKLAASTTVSLKLIYIAAATLPSADSDTISYGGFGTNTNLLDDLVAVLAARRAKVKEAEINPALEALRQELQDQILSLDSMPSSTRISLNDYPNLYTSPYAWTQVDQNQIQLLVRA